MSAMIRALSSISPRWGARVQKFGDSAEDDAQSPYGSSEEEDGVLKALASQTIQPFRPGWAALPGVASSIVGGLAAAKLRQNAAERQAIDAKSFGDWSKSLQEPRQGAGQSSPAPAAPSRPTAQPPPTYAQASEGRPMIAGGAAPSMSEPIGSRPAITRQPSTVTQDQVAEASPGMPTRPFAASSTTIAPAAAAAPAEPAVAAAQPTARRSALGSALDSQLQQLNREKSALAPMINNPRQRDFALARLQQIEQRQFQIQQRQIELNDPARQVALESAQLDLQVKKRDLEQPKGQFEKLKEGEALYRVNPRTGQYERIAGDDGSGSGKAFRDASAKQQAEIYGDTVKEGQRAVAASADINRLAELSNVVGSGAAASWLATAGPYLQSLGIESRGLSDVQAFQAIVSRMAPGLRPAGSGATSDRDMAIFMSSLPQLSQTAEGRQAIIAHIQQLQQHTIIRSRIASAALTGQITPQQAEAAIQNLDTPMFSSLAEPQQPARNQQPSGRVPVGPPAGAIAALKANPSLRGQFDAKYGAGSADKVLSPSAPSPDTSNTPFDLGIIVAP